MKTQRNPRSPYIRGVRSMVPADIESLRQPSSRTRLQNIRDSHHIIARLIVSGLTLKEVAAETGYSVARISVIRHSPAMEELIARYRGDDHSEWRKSRDATYEYMHRVRVKAARMIEEILEDEENPPKPDFVLKAFDSMSDRTNYHRKSTKENINVNFAAQLEAAFVRSREVRQIEASADEI
jgi:hypothetical protein